MKYRAAVIGCGRSGCGFDEDPNRKTVSTHAGAYANLKRIKLVALVDKDPLKLRYYQKKFCTKGYADYRKMLKQEKPDIVSICTPPTERLAIIHECIRSKVRGIFCEKPVADDLSTARKILRLCRASNVVFQVNHQRRFTSFFKNLRRQIQKQKLGQLQHVFFYYQGGILNNGTHIFDLLRFLFGEVRKMYAHPRKKGIFSDDPSLNVDLEFASGLPGTLRAFQIPNLVLFEMVLYATQAKVTVNGATYQAIFELPKPSKNFSEYHEFAYSKKITKPVYESPVVEGVKHLMRCLEGREKTLSSCKDGVKALELVKASLKSSRLGKEIRVGE